MGALRPGIVSGGSSGGVTSGQVATAIANERAATTAQAGGLPLTLASTEIDGDGSDIETALAHPFTLVPDGRYFISDLVITVRALDESLICAVTVADHVAVFTGSAWSDLVRSSGTSPEIGPGVTLTEYFTRVGSIYTPLELPGLTYTAGELSIGVPLRTGLSAKVRASGRIAFRGTSL
jgi:hypothetical protein